MKGCLLMSNFSTAQLRNFLCVSIVTVATLCYVFVSFGSYYNQDSPSVIYYGGVHHHVQNRHSNRSKNILAHELTVMNLMGGSWTTLRLLEELMKPRRNLTLLARMRLVNGNIMKGAAVNRTSVVDSDSDKLTINVAAVSCGPRRNEFLVMAKSAVMFSRDAALHFIVFSDKNSVLDIAQDLLELKWTVNRLGWDFTYELHLEWFPPHDHSDPEWRDMYKPCTTQRLFFPALLLHIDALIYLDSDVIIVSNLTELWSEFDKMGDTKLAAMTANNEDTAIGWYNTMAKIPYYGNRGVNAGVMLMNLTRMREFRFQKRAMAAQVLYNEKISLADQDIVNVIFHTFPERMHLLDCSFNFNWVHCGYGDRYVCHKGSDSFCFCKGIITSGVHIAHGNGGTFKNEYFSFLVQLYQGFMNFDFLKHSPVQLISQLRLNFTKLEDRCRPLNADMLYRNAETYLKVVENASTIQSS